MTQLEDEFYDIILKAFYGLNLSKRDVLPSVGVDAERWRMFSYGEAAPTESEIESLAQALSLRPSALLDIVNGWTPHPVELSEIKDVIVERIEVPQTFGHSNAYILGCPVMRLAAIIDPGGEVDEILRRLEARGLEPMMVLITHEDKDHVGGLKELLEKTEIKRVICHQKVKIPVTREVREDGDEFLVGETGIQMIHTPGHTPGSCCYHAGPVCFTGDTLFAGSLGGASRYTGGYQDILRSAANLMALPDDTILLPGHGPATTVREEKEHNPFIG